VDTDASARFVSVRAGPAARTLTFLLGDDDAAPRTGHTVIVRDERGVEIADVVPTPAATASRRAVPGVSLVRSATADDVALRAKRAERAEQARRLALEKIRALGLPMKLSRVEQLFDGSKLIFYFTADTRVDFRELVRQLAAEFHTRIELRQTGVRDEARMLGGYGTCGRPLCCTTWLQTFEPVSIKMAKRQDLTLNPSKLSGLCGRLKCCLRYELPNAKGELRGGCGEEGGCGNPSGCGTGACGSGSCHCAR
jgi:cell fate regulator YaaT (PSP1 superfamily)